MCDAITTFLLITLANNNSHQIMQSIINLHLAAFPLLYFIHFNFNPRTLMIRSKGIQLSPVVCPVFQVWTVFTHFGLRCNLT